MPTNAAWTIEQSICRTQEKYFVFLVYYIVQAMKPQ